MERRNHWYKAGKGKLWQFTEVCETWASYKGKTGQIYDDRYVPISYVENGLVIEVDDPDWVVLPGFRAVYDVHGDGKYIFDTCNPVVYPDREMAECAAKKFNSRPWRTEKDSKAYVIEAVYEGHAKPCREYNGKPVYNRDYWIYDRPVGSLVEEEIPEDLANCLPPKTYGNFYIQGGEPYDSKYDEKTGKYRNTFATFVKVAEAIWEWRGYCFVGETKERGQEIPYVA